MGSDWRINRLLRESVEQFEKHWQRVQSILDVAGLKFEKDYTGTTAAAGIVLMFASSALIYLDRSPLAGSVGITGGVVLVVAALVLRHRSGESQVKHAQRMIELERERARFAQRSAILDHIWLYGLPEGTPLAQIQILLGDSSARPVDESGAPLRWHALPEPQSRTTSRDESMEPE